MESVGSAAICMERKRIWRGRWWRVAARDPRGNRAFRKWWWLESSRRSWSWSGRQMCRGKRIARLWPKSIRLTSFVKNHQLSKKLHNRKTIIFTSNMMKLEISISRGKRKMVQLPNCSRGKSEPFLNWRDLSPRTTSKSSIRLMAE